MSNSHNGSSFMGSKDTSCFAGKLLNLSVHRPTKWPQVQMPSRLLTHLLLTKLPPFRGQHFKCIFNETFCLLTWISLKFVPKSPTDNKSALVLVMAWHQCCHSSLTPIYGTRERWVTSTFGISQYFVSLKSCVTKLSITKHWNYPTIGITTSLWHSDTVWRQASQESGIFYWFNVIVC